MRHIVVAALLLYGASVSAGPVNEARAHSNYQLHCQGCHTPDGTGYKSIPRLKGLVGNYLKLPAGRDYLARVPGAATSILSNKDLAEVLNWIILTFGGDSTPKHFRHYTAEEVGKLRARPLLEVREAREQLHQQLGYNEK